VAPYLAKIEWEEEDRNGNLVERSAWRAESFDENPEFPVAAVHPSILEATTAAADLKLFDQVGLVRTDPNAGGGDPIAAAVIRDTTRRKCVTFFLAWWIDPERDL